MPLPLAALAPLATKYLPMIVNTVTSVVRDKKAKKKLNLDDSSKPVVAEGSDTELINKDVAAGVSISSTRLLNVTGTPTLIMLGMERLSAGDSKVGLILIGLGVVYCLGLTFISKYSEK